MADIDDEVDPNTKMFEDCRHLGVGTRNATDGQVFMFSVEVLEKLLEKAKSSSSRTAMVFVQNKADPKKFNI